MSALNRIAVIGARLRRVLTWYPCRNGIERHKAIHTSGWHPQTPARADTPVPGPHPRRPVTPRAGASGEAGPERPQPPQGVPAPAPRDHDCGPVTMAVNFHHARCMWIWDRRSRKWAIHHAPETTFDLAEWERRLRQ